MVDPTGGRADAAIPEQVIEVPKILCPSRRVAVVDTQMAEQLVVEVPTDVVLVADLQATAKCGANH